MEYYEIFNDFINNNKIDIKLVPFVIEFFEMHRDILFLGEENNNLEESYNKNNVEEVINLRTSFVRSEISKLDVYMSELKSLKESNELDNQILIDGLIRDKEVFKNKLNYELENITKASIIDLKESLEFRSENNRKQILISFIRFRELSDIFVKEDKIELFDNIIDTIKKMVCKHLLGEEPTYSNIIEKINEIYFKLDFNYLNELDIGEELEYIINSKDKIDTKESGLTYFVKLCIFSIKYFKPLTSDETISKIVSLEHKVYSINIYNYLDKAINNPELKTYYVLMKEQYDILKEDIDSNEKRNRYLKSLYNILDTITTLNDKMKPVKIDDGIFDYNISKFDEVRIIRVEKNKKIVRYKIGKDHSYSVIEDRDVLTKELDYWKKHMNNGFDRFDEPFYDDVIVTLNYIKFYYKYKSYVMYSEINNRIFNLKDSEKEINKDKQQLLIFSEHIKKRIESHQNNAINLWKEERKPSDYFSNNKDKTIILEALLPENGIGRCINSPEMIKSIYGENYITETIKYLEKDKK